MYGKAALPENDFAYDWLPKLDVTYDLLRAFDLMFQGKMNGYFCQGFNPLMSAPNKKKIIAALSKLKFLVVMDPLATETASFWENHGEYNDVDPKSIQTEVFRLPTSCFAEESGSLTNSGRWLQWHWKGAEPPGEAKTDVEIMAKLYLEIKGLYAGGGTFPDPILNLVWPYAVSDDPTTDEIAKEVNGSALEDLPDPTDPTKPPIVKAGLLLDGFGQLRDDGKTACGCWIYSGCYTEKGNQMARRDSADPTKSGLSSGWAWSWPANRRILYNRASCDLEGKPYNPKHKLISWNGTKWAGVDVPDIPPATAPAIGPFIMNAEGVARLFTRGMMRDGPFPEHYEPFEAPVDNVLHPKVGPNPVARAFHADMAVFGKPNDFTIVATTYRLTEHFHFWSKRPHKRHPAAAAVRRNRRGWQEKGVSNGDLLEVRSNRGKITAVAVVTKRIKPLTIDGKTVHTVGIPIHWGFTGETKKGFGANMLTPYVGDANIETPEYKAFLVDVSKAAAVVS